MKKQNREVFLALAGTVGWSLCGFCRYLNSCGNSICEGGDDGETYCENPIEAISGQEGYWMDKDDDCWGFNPRFGVAVADIVGTMLSEDLDPEKTQYYKSKTGRIHVEGYKKESALTPADIERRLKAVEDTVSGKIYQSRSERTKLGIERKRRENGGLGVDAPVLLTKRNENGGLNEVLKRKMFLQSIQ